MVATSLMNSSPSLVEFSNILTATGTPFGNWPLYTLPNPPWPNFSLNRLAIFLTSAKLYLVGFEVPYVSRTFRPSSVSPHYILS